MLLAVCHSAADGWSEVTDLDKLSDLRAKGQTLLWAEADVTDLTQDDVDTIAAEFGLDPLAVEDAVHTRQRPKFEGYENHLFVVFHQLDERDRQLEAVQLACFVGSNYVLTIHAGARRTLEAAKKRWINDEPERQHPSVLLHALVDTVVDEYQDLADLLESEVEDLEETVLAVPNAPVQRQLYSVKQRVARLRRYSLPGARLLDWTIGEDPGPFSKETTRLFRDVHDHLLRISDQIKNLDELTQAMLDLVRGEQATELNIQGRKLAAWAAIFAVATVIAGIYGMNFSLVPATDSRSGFWFAIGLMAVISGALFGYFKKRNWL